MKHIIATIAIAIGLGLTAGSSAVFADPAPQGTDTANKPAQENITAMGKIENGTTRVAHSTVKGSKRLAHSTVRESRRLAHSTMRESRRIAHSTERGSKRIAHATVQDTRTAGQITWDDTKKVARSVVYSPITAYHVVRGDRPLFLHETASRGEGSRQQIALGGHRTGAQSQSNMNTQSKHNEPPI